jgi:hypothetical protein
LTTGCAGVGECPHWWIASQSPVVHALISIENLHGPHEEFTRWSEAKSHPDFSTPRGTFFKLLILLEIDGGTAIPVLWNTDCIDLLGTRIPIEKRFMLLEG